MIEQIQAPIAVEFEEHSSGIEWIKEQHESAIRKWIEERVEPVVAGWQEADASELDQIALDLEEHFGEITFGDILENFDAFGQLVQSKNKAFAVTYKEKRYSRLESIVEEAGARTQAATGFRQNCLLSCGSWFFCPK